jgi:glycosyltransferase involved in cell wall biosynthesis
VKVLQLTDAYTTGGGLEYIFQIARGMPDVKFVVMAKDGTPPSRLAALENVRCLIGTPSPDAVQEVGPDVVHTNHLRSLLAYAPRRRKSDGIRLVNTVHGVHLRQYEFKGGLRNAVEHRLRRVVEGLLVRRCDQNILLNSQDMVYARRVFGIHNGVLVPNGIAPLDGEHHAPGSARFDSPPGTANFLTIARFNFQKGNDILIRGIAALRSRGQAQASRFHLVGEGECLQECRDLATSLGVDDIIRFLGKIEDAQSLIPQARCLVLPSRWEGSPIVLLEAGRHAAAVVASDACGNSDIVLDGKTGLLFQNANPDSLADSLAKALADPGRMTEYGQALREHVATEFSFEKMIAATRRVYENRNGESTERLP